ncbi:Enoyl-CoA hydratase/carnithine racemase [Thermosyntropha lipolytica DSM 11003]|uniref:Enoyl-CoA hydratase/carnithine racemase n=1 Tax=Thermosyntropha lipolytica DSM 11003 TaxID=1123382 RepID=A0A1M5KG08_9FIRM|nr:enoyl-CoA hydratase/isomerase family protein [Thermosyntropha lipolytica]SHG51635.1 Enoyl-CoA hydratase/carnithine racemase [Thermosyntropha lipolytica DSM 11003]
MAIVEWQKDGTVAIMIMNNGENRHNPVWAEAMLATYEEILADQEIKAIVLTSSDPKYFSLGVDTNWLGEQLKTGDYPTISKWLYRNSEVFKAFLLSPVPTIAAINGHAFGNGAMLAGSCDFRFMRADRGYFCFPEIDLGIQFAPSMIEWMKRIMPYHLFIRLKFTGERVDARELEKYNVIIKACENGEKTLEEAVAFARTFNKSRTTLAEMKRRTYKHIIDKMIYEDPEYYDYKPEAAKEGRSPIFMFTPLT